VIIEAVVLTNFKNFEGEHRFIFTDINLVKGINGSGKTTLVKDSMEFCIYGNYSQVLEKLPTRGKSDKCSVMIQLRKEKDIYRIKRDYPTKITIIKNGIEIELSNNNEKQKYLNKLFGNIDYFRKFRMVDVKEGINILEEGKTSLIKTLLSFTQDYFGDKRQKLLDKKRNRELYNKDKAVMYTHSPSENRFGLIKNAVFGLNLKIDGNNKLINFRQNVYNTLISKSSSISGKTSYLQNQSDTLMNSNACPTCKRILLEDDKWKIVNYFTEEINKLKETFDKIKEETEIEKTDLNITKEQLQSELKQLEKLNRLKLRLEGRIKQKDFKWTNRDIEILKRAITELDRFYSEFITEDIKNLEPIVNNITNKINFRTKFILTEKGDFDILLEKDGEEYHYKDLSSGQKLILSIAFQIALLIQKQESGIIIADEGFGSLDINSLGIIFELFRNYPFQLVCILHRFDEVPDNVNVINL